MRRSLALFVMLAWAAPARPADSGAPPPDLAGRAWAITDVVLDRHVDPPTRQEMILAGLKALHKAGKVSPPHALARRVSVLQTPEPLAAILAEGWPGDLKTDRGGGPSEVFLEGLLSVVPGGANLLSAKEWKVEEQVEANLYVGIQVALKSDSGYPAFLQVLPGGPADQSGAKAGDVIEAIDGVSAKDMPLREVVDRIRGEEGTEVVIRLRKSDPAGVLDVPMKRGRLPRKTVQGLSPLPEGRWDVRLEGPAPIGYLKITEIAGSTPQELRAFASQMESDGLRALVLDLRQMQQSRFHPTILLADALLDGGIIGRVREADSTREIRAEPDALFRGWPMAVLIGPGRSAEVDWLCAALQDNHRATILHSGTLYPVSDGALVRSVVPLPGGEWYLRLATGRLERGDGRPLDPRPLDRRRVAVAFPNAIELDDPYVEDPVPPKRIAQVRPRSPANGPPNLTPVPSGAPRGIEEDPLPKARALLEAALKSAGS
jgi:C-terminal processing protease CtpA/Prc